MSNPRTNFDNAINDLINTTVQRTLDAVINNGSRLDSARNVSFCGEPPANGRENEDGEWFVYWATGMPIASAPLKP